MKRDIIVPQIEMLAQNVFQLRIQSLPVDFCAFAKPQAAQSVIRRFAPEIIEIFGHGVICAPVIIALFPVASAIFKKMNDCLASFL